MACRTTRLLALRSKSILLRAPPGRDERRSARQAPRLDHAALGGKSPAVIDDRRPATRRIVWVGQFSTGGQTFIAPDSLLCRASATPWSRLNRSGGSARKYCTATRPAARRRTCAGIKCATSIASALCLQTRWRSSRARKCGKTEPAERYIAPTVTKSPRLAGEAEESLRPDPSDPTYMISRFPVSRARQPLRTQRSRKTSTRSDTVVDRPPGRRHVHQQNRDPIATELPFGRRPRGRQLPLRVRVPRVLARARTCCGRAARHAEWRHPTYGPRPRSAQSVKHIATYACRVVPVGSSRCSRRRDRDFPGSSASRSVGSGRAVDGLVGAPAIAPRRRWCGDHLVPRQAADS